MKLTYVSGQPHVSDSFSIDNLFLFACEIGDLVTAKLYILPVYARLRFVNKLIRDKQKYPNGPLSNSLLFQRL